MSLLVPVESYVKSLGKPDLLDLVVLSSSVDVTMEDVEDLRPSKKKIIYSEVFFFNILFINSAIFLSFFLNDCYIHLRLHVA